MNESAPSISDASKDESAVRREDEHTSSRGFFSLAVPCATVFASSFCVMVIELVAGRIIAGNLGSSLYTWTSVIGIVLAGLSVGNYAGGFLADRFDARRTLAVLFLASSAASLSIAFSDAIVGDIRTLWSLHWPARVAAHVALVFFLPSCLLGTISPVVAKMALDMGESRGRTIGDVYAWGVVGRIFGTVTIIVGVSVLLALMATLYQLAAWKSLSWT